jgi:hypothetical protein
MKIMKERAVLAALLMLHGATHAASIGAVGLSFLGDSSGGSTALWVLNPGDLAGVAPQTNWNNIDCLVTNVPPYTGITGPLLNHAGTVTPIQLQFIADDAWSANGPTDTPNEKLMKGLLKQSSAGSMTLILTNVPMDTYDVYVYGDVDTAPQILDVNLGSTTYYWLEPGAFYDASGFIQVTNSTDPTTPGPGNYVRFSGVSPAGDGTITITVTPETDELGIAGLQLVSSTGFPLAIAGQPQSTTAAVGWPAGFAVQYSGSPAILQWFSNSVAIPGATNATYNTPPVTAGYNGAQYKVTLTNSINSLTSQVATLTVVTDPGTRVATIGASFLGNGPSGTATWVLSPADSAGVVPQTNWNNIDCNIDGIPPFVGSSELLDSAGKFTDIQLQFIATDAWNSDGQDNNANRRLMKGILKTDGVMTLTFTNLPSAFYDVYVYGAVNSGPVDLDVSLGTLTSYWTEPATFTSGFNDATSFNSNSRMAGDYVRFTGALPVRGGITLTAIYRSGSDGLGIAGVQLVSSVAFPSNTAPVGIIRQPQPTFVTTGSNATFSLLASGPFPTFQWLSNNIAIPGATAASYTTPPVTAGYNGAKYKVAISNNVNVVTSYEAPLTVTNDPGTRVAKLGASFMGDGPSGTTAWLLTGADVAGVVPQANWNNINCNVANNPPYVGTSAPLLDSAGNVTLVQFQFAANDAWNSDGPIDTPNDRLMKGLLKTDGVMTLIFWNLAPAFYDVYAYGNVNAGPVDLSVSIGANTFDWSEPAAFDDVTGFIDASDPLNSGNGNYVKFAGVTPVSGAISVTANYVSGSDGLGIAGLQLVSSAALPVRPRLTAVLQGNQILLSWNSSLSFQLQYSTAPDHGNWTNEPTAPVVSGNLVTVLLPAAGPARFFRLVLSH